MALPSVSTIVGTEIPNFFYLFSQKFPLVFITFSSKPIISDFYIYIYIFPTYILCSIETTYGLTTPLTSLQECQQTHHNFPPKLCYYKRRIFASKMKNTLNGDVSCTKVSGFFLRIGLIIGKN